MESRTAGHRFPVVDALNAEWELLIARSPDTVTDWSHAHAALAGCVDLDDVLTAIRRSPDAALGALLSEAANDGRTHAERTLAARTVLQAMLGKLVRLVGRQPDADVGPWISALWERIHRYPLGRRPVRIAANLALDTVKDVRVAERGWSTRIALLPPGPRLDARDDAVRQRGSLDHQHHVATVSAERVLAAADRLGLVHGPALRLLHSVYAEGLSGSEAAIAHRTTPGAVRARCSTAVRRLAAAAPELVAAV